ncbi:DivIVA domain-containing protein [Salininema proteolyticum]|uniref:DivIVA domain-containing protein n=1 Tax=Salininema proteolyticum TaxID=1607685 RepID=A0ABV8TT62_9ACTN
MESPYFSVQLRGYDRQQVDRAIERIRTAIELGSPPHPDSIVSLEFQRTLRGYDRYQVDEYLQDIADNLK